MLQRTLLMIADAALTASVRPPRSARHHFRELISRSTRAFDRVASAVNTVDAIVPGTAQRVSLWLCQSASLPFRCSEVRPFDYGSGDTVFRMECGGHQRVLKIQRESLGMAPPVLLQLVKLRQTAFNSTAAWYNDEFQFLIPTCFLIVHGPHLGIPAAACVQPFIEGRKHDLLRDFSDEQLLSLISHDEQLRRQCAAFVEKTRQTYESGAWVVDILGRKNLMLVEEGGRRRILSTDAEVINRQDLEREKPDELGRYRFQIDRLHRLLHRSPRDADGRR